MSLYTKYRPKDWNSVLGQDYTTTILKNALSLDRVGHAYLFHGARGTGKTTSARILAKAVNCLDLQDGNPCHKCANCVAYDEDRMLDVIEIDAASNTGVDNIRDLIDKARFEPNQGKYKIYIIDEVHMLSGGAFNALLKILEEPPKHVKFILATTEIDKVPETVRSRTQRFDFRKHTEEDIVKELELIIKSEGIEAEKEALFLIAKVARGGMRDAITLLEQNLLDGKITLAHTKSTLMIVDDAHLEAVIQVLLRKDTTKLLSLIKELRSMHINTRSYLEQLLYALRDKLFLSLNSPDYYELESIFAIVMDAHGKLRSFPDGMMLLETMLLRALKRGNKDSSSHISTPAPSQKTERTPDKGTISKPEMTKKAESTENVLEDPLPMNTITYVTSTTVNPSQESRKEEADNRKLTTENGQQKTDFSFSKLLQELKSLKPALVADLKNAKFELSNDGELTFIFVREWDYNRVNNNPTKNLLSETLERLFGGQWNINLRINPSSANDLHNAVESVF